MERSSTRIFGDDSYAENGCELVTSGTWSDAPEDALILGLRGPAARAGVALSHRHCYFGHCFKQQPGWELVCARFLRGGGTLLDLEFLTDAAGRRVASYGRNAGFIGMAAGLLAWCHQVLSQSAYVSITQDAYGKLEELPLIPYLQSLLEMAVHFTRQRPKLIVIGARGRAGSGAVSLAEKLGLSPAEWGRADTDRQGPFAELLAYDVLVNAVRLEDQRLSPFLTHDVIRRDPRSLSVIVDITCDLKNSANPLPIYKQCTSFD